MTEKLIYSGGGIEIWQRQGRFFIRYDAGAHVAALREDEITSDEVAEAMSGSDSATAVLFKLQKRLIANGVDPYSANVLPPECP